MAKLSLSANPTFESTVQIPVPGSKPVPVKFKFNAKTKDEFKAFIESLAERADVDVILEIASGWELEDPWGKESVTKLEQSYIGSAKAILETYIKDLSGARLGN
jgi:hypothetical protein